MKCKYEKMLNFINSSEMQIRTTGKYDLLQF